MGGELSSQLGSLESAVISVDAKFHLLSKFSRQVRFSPAEVALERAETTSYGRAACQISVTWKSMKNEELNSRGKLRQS